MSNVNNPTQVKGTTGTYTGDGTDHRAIPHGLGRVPVVVFWKRQNLWAVATQGQTQLALQVSGQADAVETTADAVNFHVSANGAGQSNANNNATVYQWSAI